MSRRPSRTDDAGAALLTVVLLLAVAAGLTTTAAVIAGAASRTTRSDTASTAAFAQGEAGVAQAIAYLRQPGAVKAVNAGTSAWTTSTGVSVTTDAAAARSYQVTITPLVKLSPPTTQAGTYRVTSAGTATADGRRVVEVDVRVAPQPFPWGLYVSDSLSQGNGVSGTGISVFSGKCVNKRQQIALSGTDQFYGIPVGAHAAGWITTSKNRCSATDSANVHAAGPCNPAYPFDQDAKGTDGVSAPCTPRGKLTDASTCTFGTVATSSFTPADLACYTASSRALTPDAYEELRRSATDSGTLFTTSTYTLPTPLPMEELVLYFDLRNTGSKTVNLNSIAGYGTGQCGARSLIVVVEGGDLTINAGTSLVGSLFVPDGQIKFNGSADFIGTFFAKSMDNGAGSAALKLDTCYTQNLPVKLLTYREVGFRELDR